MKYSKEEESTIIDCISKFPSNLTLAFDEAARFLDKRNAASISAHWYQVMKKRSNPKPAFAIATNQGVAINTKNLSRPEDYKRGKVSAYAVATMAVDELTIKEKLKLIQRMITGIDIT